MILKHQSSPHHHPGPAIYWQPLPWAPLLILNPCKLFPWGDRRTLLKSKSHVELCPWFHLTQIGSKVLPYILLLSPTPHSLLFSNLYPTSQACLLTMNPQLWLSQSLPLFLPLLWQGIPMACNTVLALCLNVTFWEIPSLDYHWTK